MANCLFVDKNFVICFVFELSFNFGSSLVNDFSFFSLMFELLAVDSDLRNFVGGEFLEEPGCDVGSWLLKVFSSFGEFQLPIAPSQKSPSQHASM
jgi:hypothetical protein